MAGTYDLVVAGLKDICIDCKSPSTLAHWWAPVLGYAVRPYSESDLAQLAAEGLAGPADDPTVAVDPIDGDGPTVWFNRVPEPKRGKNRLHLDVYGDVDELLVHGARLVAHQPGWTVLADPEGNEFCVFEAE